MTKNQSSNEITKQIYLFSEYLCKAMSGVNALMENHDWDNDLELSQDWWKASWELFIERELFFGHYLGSLSMDLNSRVIHPDAQAEYVVIAKSKEGQLKTVLSKEDVPIQNGLRIIGFLSVYKGRSFGYYPPFDVAELYNDKHKKKYCVWSNYNAEQKIDVIQWMFLYDNFIPVLTSAKEALLQDN